MKNLRFRSVAVAMLGSALAVSTVVPASAAELPAGSETFTGPSSSASPYLLPTVQDSSVTSVITTGDKGPNGYEMVGIPDGLGAFDNGDGTFTVVMNHELGQDKGVERAHGSTGAFVSKWIIKKPDLSVVEGSDLIQQIHLYDHATGQWVEGTTALDRLCSADLPPISALYNAESGKGYNGRIFFDGEEGGEGRAWAHALDGNSYQIAALGRANWENVLVNPHTGDTTVTIGTDDTNPGQLYVHVGEKQATGSPIEKAGLTGGKTYGITTPGFFSEKADPFAFAPETFAVADMGDAGRFTSVDEMDAYSAAHGVTEWFRPEDGAWDVNDPNVFYFTATGSVDSTSRLWKLEFTDVTEPELGGKVTMLADGARDGFTMIDNMAASRDGKTLLLTEDVGDNPWLGRALAYDIPTGAITPVLEHDPARFLTGGEQFLTENEEASGQIDVSDILGEGAYLITTQNHAKADAPQLVEGGQLQLARFGAGVLRPEGAAHENGDIPVTAEIPARDEEGTQGNRPGAQNGALALSIAEGGLQLGNARETGLGYALAGVLPQVSVTDTRADAAGWSVTGSSSDLSSDAASLPAANLGWAPFVVAGDATPGAEVDPATRGGKGLALPALLGSSAGGKGQDDLSADVELVTPADTKAGTYQGAVTVSLFPQD